jgi:integrase
MLTGARLRELCQLNVADVREDHGVWYLRLTTISDEDEADAKSLKTEGSKRDIPIHSELVRLGFIAFIRAQQERKGLLFQNRYPSPDILAREYSKQFRSYKTDIGITTPGVKFHSFRHGFKTAGRLANIPEEVNDALTGQLPQTVAGKYGNQQRLIAYLKTQIDRIGYEGLDLSGLVV